MFNKCVFVYLVYFLSVSSLENFKTCREAIEFFNSSDPDKTINFATVKYVINKCKEVFLYSMDNLINNILPCVSRIIKHFGLQYEVGDRCVTPNGEIATCELFKSCDHIFQSVLSLDEEAVQFAKQSQCEGSDMPLICCGNATAILPDGDIVYTTLLANRSICGIDRNFDRIHGGQITELNDFPWMALLGYKESFSEDISFKCGGTLINNRYVLTAAHCIRINPEIKISLHLIRLGEWNVTSDKDCQGTAQHRECANPVIDVLIEKQIAHPKYSRKTGNNDIGLIRLRENVKYTSFILPICLPFNKASIEGYPLNELTVSGWGATETGPRSVIKLKLDLPIIPSVKCQSLLGRLANITDSQICAGGEKGRDACQGDSGGPLMGYKETSMFSRQWYQEGIISFGFGCGRQGIPGVYTKVTQYLVWIIENLEEF